MYAGMNFVFLVCPLGPNLEINYLLIVEGQFTNTHQANRINKSKCAVDVT